MKSLYLRQNACLGCFRVTDWGTPALPRDSTPLISELRFTLGIADYQLEHHPRLPGSPRDEPSPGHGAAPERGGRGQSSRDQGPYTRPTAQVLGPQGDPGRPARHRAHGKRPARLLAHHNHPQLPEGCFPVRLAGDVYRPCLWRADGSIPA